MEKQKKIYKLVASCAVGLEPLVAGELHDNGGQNIQVEKGAVSCQSGLETAYRLCLWSRFASRIFVKVASFSVKDEDELYRQFLLFCWQEHLQQTTTFAINCTLRGKTKITNNRFAALRVKDALVDYFRNLCNDRPSVQARRPAIQFHLFLEAKGEVDKATLYIDFSGEPLHRRGYRVATTLAPLKENLAAAIIALSGWQLGEALVDPMCGSGTLLIEAAMMFGDVAPGISRPYFGFFGWRQHDNLLWQNLVDEATSREEAGLDKKWPVFLGYDADPVAVSAARKNIVRAGLDGVIQVKQGELATLTPPCKEGVLVSNLPFGERLLEKEMAGLLYRAMGRIAQERFFGWKLAFFISNPELTDSFFMQWQRKEPLFHGGLQCRLLCGLVEDKRQKNFVLELAEQPEISQEIVDFANRLRKNFLKNQKRAIREGISCFRLYDRDLPEYNFAIDLYEKWFHLQEYAPPKSIDPEIASRRIKQASLAIQALFGVRSNRIFIKRRERQRGKKQYEKKKNLGKMFTVKENRASFLVNFTDYLDTGLFLDHRPVRSRIFAQARGKRFLNLFAYTGTATVQAALGGAASTTTVDLSANYLHWARKNMALNGFSEHKHSFIKADSLEWLRQAQEFFDLIFLDPPTFSNTKKAKRVFDIQKDHPELIQLAASRLAPDGILVFSTNYRRFSMDESLFLQYDVRDISTESIPYDFQRNDKIHQCWELRRLQ